MKKVFLSASLFIAAAMNLSAQTKADFDKAVNMFQSQYNNKQYNDIYNTFSDRIKKAITPEKTGETMGMQYNQFGELKTYSYVKQEGQFNYYKLNFANTVQTLVISLDKTNKLEAFRFIPYTEAGAPKVASNFIYKSPTGNLYGTLEAPEGTKAVPVVLLIAGSGPTDRNCNQATMETNAFKMLADSLKKAGIASVRYDKRGVGESAGSLKDENGLLFEDMVNDAAGFVKMLKNDKRFSSVIVAGHSEGSLVGMMAAAREKANGYISIAGLGDKADKIIVRQIAAQSEELSLKAAFIMDSMSKGHTVKNVDPSLASLFRPEIQPYIKSWIKLDPSEEIKKLSCPVLVIQGNNDLQVPTEEADILKAAYPKATVKVIKDMNHVLKLAPADRVGNMTTYTKASLPISAEFSKSVVAFVTATAAGK